ncbi:hypothetical protein CWIS_13550 [Cellulomonas sp. A375-1]|uniref:hypothetical protein n=1 Tax=Cellulomonas sp. A375-1 TaxID=1672219 RepID=UPI00065283EB|nr:hypothetical protein [Cellulomonas sp. A375-1]KMM44854.1 hypothetical protein CWIS_13550 [Cellulomonas sp. A375-1]
MNAHELTPDVSVVADLGDGAAVDLQVLSWSITRDLTGGSLPGQVRAASGFSVGSGEVVFDQADDATAWKLGPIAPGGPVSIDAVADAADTPSPVARMTIRKVSAPSALSTERAATISDVSAGTTPVTLPAALQLYYDSWWGAIPLTVDAAWVIDRAARALGFFACPEPTTSAILSASLIGSSIPEVGALEASGGGGGATTYSWSTDDDGRIYPDYQWTMVATEPWVIGETVYVSFSRRVRAWERGWGTGLKSSGVSWRTPSTTGFYVSIDNDASTFQLIHSDSGASTAAVAWTPDPGNPRVQAQVERVSATSTRVRLRGGSAGTWSPYATLTHPSVTAAVTSWGGVNTSGLTGLQVHRADDPALRAAPTARISASGSNLAAVFASDATDAWGLLQDVASKTLGGAWKTEAGELVYRNRAMMRGLVGAPATITAAESVIDLPWSIGDEDVADRIEISYTPPDQQHATDGSVTVWRSAEMITIPARRTVTIYADIDGVVDDLAPWLPTWDTSVSASRMSRWSASTQRSGGGAQPDNGALSVVADIVNPSRVRIRITNNTATTLYTAGTDGTTQLILRADTFATPGQTSTVAAGVSAEASRSLLRLDLSPWVQDDDVAREVLGWLSLMTAEPLPVLDQIEIVPDLSIRLGDIRVLSDPVYTGVQAKVLVMGSQLSGEPGALTQTLRIAILEVIEGDLAQMFLRNLVSSSEAWVAAYVTAGLGAGATEQQAGEYLRGKVLT